MLDAIGIRGLPATILHLVIDGAHHTVYAVATGFAYDVLLAIDRAAGKDG